LRTRHILFAGLMALTLIPACASEEQDFDSIEDDQSEVAASADDGKADAAPSSWTYYSARRDLRKCVSPLCGGWFVKRVNQTWTQCPGTPGGWTTGDCYVAEIATPSGIGVGDVAVLKGSVASKVFPNFGNLRQFKATEVWNGLGTAEASGLFYRVNATQIYCITFPCNNPTTETKLNSYLAPRSIFGINLAPAAAAPEDEEAAQAQLLTRDGLIAQGDHVLSQNGFILNASNFFIKAKAELPKCYVGGCSGQVCSDQPDVITTCEFRTEYACYRTATCERQADGACGWTQTAELRACLQSPPTL